MIKRRVGGELILPGTPEYKNHARRSFPSAESFSLVHKLLSSSPQRYATETLNFISDTHCRVVQMHRSAIRNSTVTTSLLFLPFLTYQPPLLTKDLSPRVLHKKFPTRNETQSIHTVPITFHQSSFSIFY
jgi:hypothetical protein